MGRKKKGKGGSAGQEYYGGGKWDGTTAKDVPGEIKKIRDIFRQVNDVNKND